MAGEPPTLSLVFPAYNEAEGLQAALEVASAYLDRQALKGEIVVVNDGSRDDTLEVAQALAEADQRVRVLSHSPNHGKGYAVKQGMLNARGAYRVFLDVDLATPVEEATKLLAALERGADVAIGSRHLPGSRIEVPQRFLRRSMGSVFRSLARRMLRTPVSDFTCGCKGFRAFAAERLFGALTEPGWAFDAELILLATKAGLRLEEVPVRWRDVAHSAVAPLSAALESWRALRRVQANERRGAYDGA